MIGQTISHYKILEKLGEGGMGVVYKAQDTKLDRIVALKFLPPHLAADEQDKKRFIHEAKAASALDHPNICTIFEIDETLNHGLFISMALYEGSTLNTRIEQSPLKIEDALDIALQAAEGLQAAHEKGIVHRDIKSSNIMVTSSGRVVLMDFGLARSGGMSKLTKTGSTVGTVPYMSPEQARGDKLDHRTDIWSFGMVLYEMITGRLPFKSDYNDAVIYSILNQDPEPVTALRTGVPMELERIVVKMLQKNAGERYQSMNDLLVDLRALKRTMESGTTIISPPVSYRKPRRKTILLAASAVTALLCIGAVVFLLLPSYPSVELNPGMTMRVLPIPLTSIGYPGLSADGNWIAFPAADEKGNWDIYLMNAAAGEPRRITFDSSSSVSVMTAQISPDGSLIAYSPFSVQRKDVSIHLVSALGGRSRIIAENAFIPVWQPDGRRVFYMRGLFSPRPSSSGKLEIWSVKPDGSDERLEVIDTISVLGRTSLSISPNGKNIIWIRSFSEGQYQELVITDLKNKEERQLTFDKKNIDEVYWAPNDQIIFSSNKSGSTNLWMVPAAGGQEIQITKGAGPDVGMKVSADGKRLLYYQNQFTGNIWIGSLENGSAHQLTFDETIKQLPMLSPDGKSIAFLMSSFDPLNPHSDLYVCDNDGLNRRILSTNQDVVFRPYWSQDSRSIAYPVRQSDINADSVGGSKTYVVDVAKSLRPKFIANGRPLGWVSSTILQVVTSPGTPRAKGMLTSIEMGRQGLSSQDSALLKPIWGHRLVGQDWGLLIGKDDLTDGVIAKIMSFQREGARVSTSLDFKHAILCEKPGELWRISLAEGERKRVPFVFPGLSTDFSVSPDGKQLVYVQQRQQGRLVMIENPFK